MKLLIADDQRSVHLYLEKALDLQALGFECVLHAENGAQALGLICEERPDVMLLDIQMPVMDGIALLERLSEQGIERPETLVLSAYDEFVYAKRCIDFGVRHYMLKPIDPHEMSRLLTDIVGLIRARRLDAYRRAFPICCAHAGERPDASLMPSQEDAAFSYAVLCLRAQDAQHPALETQAPVCRCAAFGRAYLLVAAPVTEERLAGALQAEAIPAGMSGPHDALADLPAAVREAEQALAQSFYAPALRCVKAGFFAYCSALETYGCLGNIADSFMQADSLALSEMVERAFALCARRRFAPEAVLEGCRRALSQIRIAYCGEKAPDLHAWPQEGGFLPADALREALVEALLSLKQRVDPAASRSDAEAIARIRAYVDAHYGEDLSLAAMSARFFISRHQISRLFKQICGVHYQDYVISVRMKAAAHLLAHTKARLYEISAAVGFDEPSYFSNVFKKTYGLSPRAYRLTCNDAEEE